MIPTSYRACLRDARHAYLQARRLHRARLRWLATVLLGAGATLIGFLAGQVLAYLTHNP